MKASTVLWRIAVSLVAGVLLAGASLLVVRGGTYHPPTPPEQACPPTGGGAQCMALLGSGSAYYDSETKGWPFAVVTIEKDLGGFEAETVHGWAIAGDVLIYALLVFVVLSSIGPALRLSRTDGATP